ncbi:MAG: hypothetical protein ACP5NE_01165 [Candidatus Micrarchaeia archaeon]
MESARLSRGPNGEARFDYFQEGEESTLLIEKAGEGILESLFDRNGAVLKQVMLKGDQKEIEREVEELSKRVGQLESSEYREVTLQKSCPHCGSNSLKRSIDFEKGDVPVVPTYVCGKCGGRSYYLTEQYLRGIVSSRKDLFSESEKKELEVNEEAFLKELKEYIIRIFASKRIIAIR